MTKKSFPPAAFSHQGVDFSMCYTYPAADKHKDMPCRGRINPLDPMTGKCLTKRQLYGKDSDARSIISYTAKTPGTFTASGKRQPTI